MDAYIPRCKQCAMFCRRGKRRVGFTNQILAYFVTRYYVHVNSVEYRVLLMLFTILFPLGVECSALQLRSNVCVFCSSRKIQNGGGKNNY